MPPQAPAPLLTHLRHHHEHDRREEHVCLRKLGANRAIAPGSFARFVSSARIVSMTAPPIRTIAREDVEELDQRVAVDGRKHRSEEHTSELQSHSDLVCRLLLEEKNTTH